MSESTTQADMAGGLLTIREAAAYLRVSQRQLFNLTRDGGIPAVPVGRRGKRYSRRTLDEWIKGKETVHGKPRE